MGLFSKAKGIVKSKVKGAIKDPVGAATQLATLGPIGSFAKDALDVAGGLAPQVDTTSSEQAIQAAVAAERAQFEEQVKAGAPATRSAGRAIKALSTRDFEGATQAAGGGLLTSRLGRLGATRSTALGEQTRRLGAAGGITKFNRGLDIASKGVQAGAIGVNPNLAGTIIAGTQQRQGALENLANIQNQGLRDVLGGLSTGAAAFGLFREEGKPTFAGTGG